MNQICEVCRYKDRLFCKNTHILQEDIPVIFETHYLKEVQLKNSIKTKKGVDELYNLLLAEKRNGQYLALSFSNFPCLICENCTLEHHMKEGYKLCSNRKLVRCIGLLGIQPKIEENVVWILLKKDIPKPI